MQKFLLVILVGAALAMGGWRGFQYYHAAHVKPTPKVTSKAATTVEKANPLALQAIADAKLQVEAAAARSDIEAQLKPLKVTSIMPGQPGIVIIDKKEYAEGDPFSLPRGGRKLQVAKVDDDGVLLAYNGLTFRLNAPAAPDLEALRKK